MPSNALFILALERDIDLNQPFHSSPTLQSEGFIHACTAGQVSAVYQRFYATHECVYVAVVDARLVEAEIKYEAPSVPIAHCEQYFPHIYGQLNTDAIVDVLEYRHFIHQDLDDPLLDVLAHYRFSRLPVEGTLYKSTWRADTEVAGEKPAGTAMIGMYCHPLKSVSCFHRLNHDEIWHFYAGDPFCLYLLYPDGNTQTVVMGTDFSQGQLIQCRIPAGVWQAGEVRPGGDYAIFGCTMAPGFTGDCFEAADHEALKLQYPKMSEAITRLAVNKGHTAMPDGFAS
ncbi:cupin domain-containing protein [Pseudoalteromonas sp. SMS1]|uniref:cupin domain-containing protein n=1 Tax=Pseudoalteromonas sp. SMS1 TaxID=2908894 RepID=UPI001F3D6ADB|nr:cupin domain-containing protein [Pseudoalteromonas sp. SMS1]MCF2857736.1 cupin domain-containing protein [Pseudoalteromonas sp. SMS1]